MSRLSARIKFLIRALGVNGYIIRLVIARSVLMRAVKLRLPVSELLAIVDGAIEQNNRFYRRTNYSDWQSLYAPTDFFGRGFPPSVGVTVVVCPRRSSLSHLYKSLRSIERERSPAIDVVVLSTGPWSDFLLGMAAYAAGGAKSVIIRRPTDLEGLLRERVALIQGAPVLRPGALGALNASMDKDPSTRAVYADEDRTIGKRVDFPQFKPDFSPVLGQQYDYVGNVILFTREFFLSNVLPDVRINAIPSWIGDRSLPQGAVVHLPQVLHSEQTRRRLTHISGAEFDQELAMTIQNEAQRPSVAIIIPTRDREELLRSCIQGIDECTDYDASRISIIIVDNGTVEPAAVHLLSQLEARHNFSVVKRPGEFNYSWLCNQGAAAAAADILVFMNNDIVLRDRNWLGKLVSAVSLPSVGVVGCKLLYPSGKIQHAGVILGIHGLAGHIGVGANEFDGGYLNLAKHTRELSAVTGALVAVRRSVFQAAGGYDERLAIAFSDIALCLTCNGLGFQTLCLQSALAFHLESASRGDDTLDPLKHIRLLEECLQVLSTHGSLKIDPFYNPNLSLIGPYELADPPRLVARTNLPNRAPRVLMLSWTFQVGHGVAVVVDIQARALESMGCVVFIGAPVKANEIPWPKNRRLDVSDENTAAKLAAELNFDVVMVHTPPFFSVFKVLPMNISGIAYDYGEPPPSLFPDT
ncbi:MAG TPA: glycosyltransferase, partial [Caulobacteraceae bacterium]|nr:glycosyltransferase [Caulobacteraceae bacterium]